jgi:hypothetical protein
MRLNESDRALLDGLDILDHKELERLCSRLRAEAIAANWGWAGGAHNLGSLLANQEDYWQRRTETKFRELCEHTFIEWMSGWVQDLDATLNEAGRMHLLGVCRMALDRD